MRSKTSHAAESGVGEHTARESESAQRVRRERVRGEHPPPNLAPEPQGSGALFFLEIGGSRRGNPAIVGSPLRSVPANGTIALFFKFTALSAP
jgi:hypothetical protein